MAVDRGALVDGSDTTINSTTWVVAKKDGPIEVPMDPNQRLHVQVEYNPQATPTDTFEFRVVSTVRGSDEWDDVPIRALAMDNTGSDPKHQSVWVEPYYKVRFEGRLTGSTDSSTFKVAYRKQTRS